MGVESIISTVLFTLKERGVNRVCTPEAGNLSILSITLCMRNDTPRKIEISNVKGSMLLFSTGE